jgi:four helix bundle protein
MKESPIFTRTYDLLRWLIPATVKFPRQQRFVLAGALQQSALAFQEQIVRAAYSRQPRALLEEADATLALLRTQLRLCHDLELLSKGQFRHVAGMVNEIGKLLGGWLKTV